MDEQPDRRRPWRRVAFEAIRHAASLRLAVVLLGVLIGVLIWGTAVESRHGARAAHDAVYGRWWFIVLGALMAANIAAAMAGGWATVVRRRRRFCGFLLTHFGVLVLLAGCLVTRLWGVEAMLSVFEGRANHVAETESRKPLELGFQVHLRDFRRRLDPGSDRASHYSSRVDFLRRNAKDDDKPLQADVLITLNAPVDFSDPQSGRTYRLFQSSFEGPWLPGDPEFDQIVGSDHDRDQVYLSQFTVNYDPGRELKYAGSLAIVVGLALVYYGRKRRGS